MSKVQRKELDDLQKEINLLTKKWGPFTILWRLLKEAESCQDENEIEDIIRGLTLLVRLAKSFIQDMEVFNRQNTNALTPNPPTAKRKPRGGGR